MAGVGVQAIQERLLLLLRAWQQRPWPERRGGSPAAARVQPLPEGGHQPGHMR